MLPDGNAAIDATAPPLKAFTAADVGSILRERGWTRASGAAHDDSSRLGAWLVRAAQLLGPHAATRDELASLLALIFAYDAPSLLADPASHALLSRSGAREVIRDVAHGVLAAAEIDSDAFKSLIDGLKEALPHRGPALFGPIRLALAGRIGEGELDRVILLLDSAARLDFAVPVKGTRQRILEFCAALD
jgi:hypothetical protein